MGKFKESVFICTAMGARNAGTLAPTHDPTNGLGLFVL